MFQTTVIPESRNLHIVIPSSLVGKELKVSANEVKRKKQIKKKNNSLLDAEIDEFYDSLKIDLSNFKFNRDEIYEG